ncbi:hypothetical protein Ait01nite_067210 [Actinoplanes italicus]|uniref:Barstar (Barnase inhibitor) n=1 Tax=Actinoplanes italicus TaxID=113567 RepID=A0A2T0K151_9ACTN|nr:barstar family protein [Actinoplanes italicus]PRX16470.1 barstar (barnase inhibitor) [Actinoplanes italicus]GIE33676.1 hypothetical protein Ait01nite_067210 [Actinoplanes italicus]
MDAPTLTQPQEPWVVFTRADDPWVPAEAERLRERGGAVARLDGRELLDKRSLMAAFRRGVDLPGYFSGNWDSLAASLHERHGHGSATADLAVLIDHADELLHADHLGLFVAVLCQGAWQANLRIDADGYLDVDYAPRNALHFVFLLDATDPEAFAGPAATEPEVLTALVGGRLTATTTGPDHPSAPLRP